MLFLQVELASREEQDAALPLAKACFDGVILATIAYGALAMLYLQLTQVLLVRPRRDRTFWAVVAYSVVLAAVVTLTISAKIKFAEIQYIYNPNYPGGCPRFYKDFANNVYNSIDFVCTAFFPWFADILMFLRLYTITNKKWCVLIFPCLTYLTKSATSILLLIAEERPEDQSWSTHMQAFGLSYHASTLAFNFYITLAIAFQIFSTRKKLAIVTGRLHASFYTSIPTIFVEAGGFFTCWILIYLIISATQNYTQNVFHYPDIFILGITRMLIILRIAQDRAWSLDLVTASERGVLDWQVSSSRSVPISEDPFHSQASLYYNRRTSRKMEDIHSIS